jgi:hypothetical protein
MIIILVLVLILICVIFYFNFKVKENFSLWKNQFRSFPVKEFFRECGDIGVLLSEYNVDGKPDLFSNRQRSIKLKDWATNNQIFDGNRQTKLAFSNDSKSPIPVFIKKWLKNNRNVFPDEFNNIREPCEYTLRISRNKWEYPSHFDAVDNFTFILHGSRNVKLNEKIDSKPTTLKLNKNDILFFRNGVYHHFWCDETDELNMVLNVCFVPTDTQTDKKFNKQYPQRVRELIIGMEKLD